MAGKSQNKTDRKTHIFAVLAAFFCIGTAALFPGMTASAEIPWGEKLTFDVASCFEWEE